jgi:hypothetical protein
MNKTFMSRHIDSPSDNRKPVLSYAEGSKIKNPKFALVLSALLFAARTGVQSKNCQTDWPHDPAECAGESGSSDQMKCHNWLGARGQG